MSGCRTREPCQLLILNTAASEKSDRSCNQLGWKLPRVAVRQCGRWHVMAAGAADSARRGKWTLVPDTGWRSDTIFANWENVSDQNAQGQITTTGWTSRHFGVLFCVFLFFLLLMVWVIESAWLDFTPVPLRISLCKYWTCLIFRMSKQGRSDSPS